MNGQKNVIIISALLCTKRPKKKKKSRVSPLKYLYLYQARSYELSTVEHSSLGMLHSGLLCQNWAKTSSTYPQNDSTFFKKWHWNDTQNRAKMTSVLDKKQQKAYKAQSYLVFFLLLKAWLNDPWQRLRFFRPFPWLMLCHSWLAKNNSYKSFAHFLASST